MAGLLQELGQRFQWHTLSDFCYYITNFPKIGELFVNTLQDTIYVI
jgi:hypothetical protein